MSAHTHKLALELVRLVRMGQDFTADDACVKRPSDVHANSAGGVYRVLANKGLVECIGYAKSRQASRGGGATAIWRPLQPSTAQIAAFLENYPEPQQKQLLFGGAA